MKDIRAVYLEMLTKMTKKIKPPRIKIQKSMMM